MNDTVQEGQAPAPSQQAEGAPQETPEAQATGENATATDAGTEQDQEPQPQAGSGDVSTAPPTAPAPLPGVPSTPVNAVRSESDPIAPVIQPERIGEAVSVSGK